ncbi:MAG: sugar ABC transporter substrate-binding protein [Desulfitobacterium hafniense]|nr:sugar ABC transporter substrate-binding protein [Desulfitobacterium hafniense]
MKKGILILLVVSLILSITACNTPAAKTDNSTQAPASNTSEQSKPAEAAQPAEASKPAVIDYKNFQIDPSKISKEKLNTTLYVAASVRGLDNPYIVTIIQGMDLFTKYLDSIGQKYEKQTLDSGGSNDKEVDNMKQFAAKANGNAIAYSDPNESAIAPALAEAMAASGGFIGTAWNKPDDVNPWDYDPNWVIHTSPDNVVGGYNISKALSDAIGGGGEIFVLEGMLGNTAATDRAKGLEKYLAENPNLKVVNRDTANWDTKQALTLVETWLNKNPNVKGIWAANDNMATGAIQALDKAGLKGKVAVVGIDATTDMIKAIDQGFATATVSSNGYLQGGYTLAILYAAWAGLIDPAQMPQEYRKFATPSMLVTKDNVKQYIADYIDKAPQFDFSKIFYAKAD